GGTGLIGKAISAQLLSAGHTVKVVTRTPKSNNHVTWDSIKSSGLPPSTQVVINTTGRSIGEVNPLFCLPGRYKQYIEEVFSSRIDTTKILVKAAQSFPLKAFINASAVGFYKPSLTETFTEAAAYEDHGMITRLVKEWELAAQMPERKDIKQYQLRLGVVLAENSNFVKSLYPSHRVGLGGPIASGRQWISWIHLDDVVRIVQYLLDPESSVPVGPVNATAPFACRQDAVSKAFSEAVNAPNLPFGPIRTPAFVAKLILGSDRSTLLLEGQRVVPQKLLDAGFNFKYPRLEDALEAIFQRRPTSIPTD
ncbi:TIGR01777 family protein, partial [Opisthorchis viverrini]